MLIVGLTGSVAMGKSTTVAMLRAMDIPVHDADACVHKLFEPEGEAFASVAAAFPTVLQEGRLNRKALGQIVFQDKSQLKTLEAIVHPLVARETKAWLEAQEKESAKLVVLDIPLLFEVGREAQCDAVLLVSASYDVQKARYLSREGATLERFQDLLSMQMSDVEKRRRATVILDTSAGLKATEKALQTIISQLKTHITAKAWPQAWSNV